MPLFHFYLVTDLGREHMSSIELPHARDLVPVGVKVARETMADVIAEKDAREGWTIQATNDAGGLLYNITIRPGRSGEARSGWLQ